MAEDNRSTIFECDHMRPVVRGVREGDRWFHIGPDGRPSAECSAGVYKVKATTEPHTVGRSAKWGS